MPDYITRVTEYVPEIVKFIEKIIDNGYAYESNKSVYFDIEAYRKKFKYGKLKRMKDAQTEEEQVDQKNEKRNKEDFVLWKNAKPNEPTWKSPWGQGRPGWHIECSAMAVSILGQKMDLHSGGIDLIFPHHENELAQSEAFNNQEEWTKYFLHVGHLHIKGLKMSKSLKNFTTIKQLLELVDARIIKLYFFIHRYDVIMNYDPETSLNQAKQKDTRYKNFYSSLSAAIRGQKLSNPQKLSEQDTAFDNVLDGARTAIHQAFCNNIDTPTVIREVDEAIKKVNNYMGSKTAKAPLLKKAHQILIHPFNVMGINFEEDIKASSIEDDLLNSICKFRDEIRENSKSEANVILDICDKFRDYAMVDLSIRLEDKKIGEPSVWKYQAKETLEKQRQAKLQAKRKKERQQKEKQEEKLRKMKVNPKQMFREDKKWTKFDEDGIPTFQKVKEKIKEGDKTVQKQSEKPVNQKLRNKLIKEYNAQKLQYQKYLEQSGVKEEKDVQKQEK